MESFEKGLSNSIELDNFLVGNIDCVNCHTPNTADESHHPSKTQSLNRKFCKLCLVEQTLIYWKLNISMRSMLLVQQIWRS